MMRPVGETASAVKRWQDLIKGGAAVTVTFVIIALLELVVLVLLDLLFGWPQLTGTTDQLFGVVGVAVFVTGMVVTNVAQRHADELSGRRR